MKINKNTSITGSNNEYIPSAEVTNKIGILSTLGTKNIPQNSKGEKSKTYKTKNNSKTKVTVGLNFDNGVIETQYLTGSVKYLVRLINKYKIPKTNINYPVNISISYNDDELRKLQTTYTPEPESADMLYFYFLKSVKNQLLNIPEQYVSTQLAANILNIRKISLLDRLKKGQIPTKKFENQKCIRSGDLFRFKEKIDKERSEALDKLIGMVIK